MCAHATHTVCPLRARTCCSSVVAPNAKSSKGDLEAMSRVTQKQKIELLNLCARALLFLLFSLRKSVDELTTPVVKVGQNHFLENKVVINYDFRHGAKKSGQSGHSFRSYGYLSI